MIIHQIAVLLSLYLITVDSGYTITTPRRWTVDQSSQICLTLTEPSTGNDYINVFFKTFFFPWQDDKKEVTQISTVKIFAIPAGMQSVCYEYILPKTTEDKIAIQIEGNLQGKNVSHSQKIAVVGKNEKTYIQTDKYLYKPGQNVQFRILSLKSPLLHISTENYDDIWVENPSSSRIQQWKNVTNPDGLLHRSFTLSEEPDQGEYNIKVQLTSGLIFSTNFKVEDYVLPRYEITVTPPSFILATSKNKTFKVCARYTFGQPVKGLLTFVVDNGGWAPYNMSLSQTTNISGCTDMEISIEDLKINSDVYHAYKINFKASVVEEGTDVTLESEYQTVPIERVVITFKDVGQQQYRKPGIPFIDEVLAELPDGSPAINEPMQLCISDICKNMSTNAKGILKYAIPPNTDETIYIKAILHQRIHKPDKWRSIMYESSIHRTQKTYYSPSNSSLVIALDENNLKCQPGKSIDFELVVRYASSGQENTLVHVQVISRGLIQYFASSIQDFNKSSDMHIPEDIFISPMNTTTTNLVRGSFIIPISLPTTISPKAEILIWYERKDKEVVSDHRSIDIQSCLPNDVKLHWSRDLARPGDKAILTIDSEPMSLCSLGVVDKSVELLSSTHNSMTIKKLLELGVASAVLPNEEMQVDDFKYCNAEEPPHPINFAPMLEEPIPQPRRLPRSFRRRFHSTNVAALTMFNGAGVFVFSDLTVDPRPCIEDVKSYLLGGRPMWRSAIQFGVHSHERVAGPVGRSQFSPQSRRLPPTIGEKGGKKSHPRIYFPETWLWQLSVQSENGTVQMPLVLPDTVTEWVGRAVCVHPTKGIGLSETAAITTFKDFFIDLTLPATVKRGEILPVKVSIFNYLKEQLPVKLSLLESADYDILTEDKEDLGSGLRSACVNAEGKIVFSIRIKPKIVGQMNITVDAMIDINSIQCGGTNVEERRDLIVKPITVDYEGFPKEKTWNNYICIEENNKTPSDIWEMVAPSDIVNGSSRGWLTVVSDLMGPTIENLGHLVRMPYGCGEQNMLNFAPNIFILQYLEAINETTEKLGSDAIRFMEKGYQRELNYRHSDGSFSAFGSSDSSGSTWLTAFVLKSFVNAQQFINIDLADLAMSADWIKSKQLENGCFERVGKVIHKDMKGGLQDSGSPSLLSAYVLLSLLEAGEDPNSPVVREAQFCLDADSTIDPYAMAVKLYALVLAKSPEAQPLAKAFLSMANQTHGSVSWDISNDSKKSKSTAVEIASYAVLSLLTLDKTEYADVVHQIIKWINQQRNAQGGFISTQDTILALQAMALYEATLPAGETDAFIQFTSNNYEEHFQINKGNKLLLQKTKLPSIPATVAVEAFGTGCVLVQGVLRYNVLEGDANTAFSLTVTTETPYDPSCKTKEIKVCTSYLLPDLVSNMAIIEVNLVSGYIPDKESLKRIVGYGTSFFKRYEVDGSTVLFYLDEIPAEELCAKLKIIREVAVENIKPGTVKVYDYYKPENIVSQNYVLPDISECSKTKPELLFEMEIIPNGN